MQFNQNNIKKFAKNLRFKRWSRVNYAVFASISSCVTIGRLKASIADCLLKKQENSASENYTEVSFTFNKDNDALEETLLALLINNQSLFFTETALITLQNPDFAISIYKS